MSFYSVNIMLLYKGAPFTVQYNNYYILLHKRNNIVLPYIILKTKLIEKPFKLDTMWHFTSACQKT